MSGLGIALPWINFNRQTWYVDANGGSDGSGGHSPQAAFKTIAALLAAAPAANDVIFLKAGSHWRETLTLPADGISVYPYGSGADPLLDASDEIDPAAWSKTGGYSNVYQAAISAEESIIAFVNCFEDGAYLSRASSIAECDTTPGSVYPSAESGTFTLYLHTSASNDPGVNGSSYEVSIRNYGLLGSTNCVVQGIHTRRNLNHNGSMIVGPGSKVVDCTVEQGHKHNLYIQDGCQVINTTIKNAYFPTGYGTLLVYNQASPSGQGINLDGVTLQMDAIDARITLFNGHINVGGNFGPLSIKNCAFVNSPVAMSLNDISSLAAENNTFSGCQNVYTAPAGIPVSIKGGTISLDTPGSRAFSNNAGAQTVMDGVNICVTQNVSGGVFYLTQAASLEVKNCKISNDTASGLVGFYVTDPGMNLNVHDNHFSGSKTWWRVYYFTVNGVAFQADHNHYNPNFGSYIESSAYTSLADHQAGSGQDLNSAMDGDASGSC